MSDPIKLDKIITIDGQDYEIYAVRSDASGNADNAEKVSNKLKITKSTYNTDTKNQSAVKIFDYDGSNEQDLSIVPASGGAFTGPVYIAHTSEDGTTYERITNEAGVAAMIPPVVENIVQQLKGVPGWAWDGENASKLDNDESLSKIDMIIGEEDHIAGNSLLSLCDTFTYFLFFCLDTGNIYLRKNKSNSDLLKLVNSVDFANRATNADNAENAKKAASIVGTVFDEAVNYSAIDIYNAIKKGEYNEASITKIINGNTCVDRAAYLYDAGKNYRYSANYLYETRDKVDKIEDGTTIVPKASKDSDGREIQKNYYVKKGNTAEVNSITISASTPTNSKNGDIWIKI